jgi:hypothetical protein|tara:strand:- start:326 stop:547 length:222 start_codon:yes stop_codon:yes gene_type:complete
VGVPYLEAFPERGVMGDRELEWWRTVVQDEAKLVTEMQIDLKRIDGRLEMLRELTAERRFKAVDVALQAQHSV